MIEFYVIAQILKLFLPLINDCIKLTQSFMRVNELVNIFLLKQVCYFVMWMLFMKKSV
jgi:hypothetical protein